MQIETENLILKKENNTIVGDYYIYEKESNKLIGSITYRGHHHDIKLGDIGSLIHASYTNKGYGKEALFKLIDLLKENNIEDFWITCEEKNQISKHIINEYLNVESIREIHDVLLYRCNTECKKRKK